jgi:hypothetical protein
MAMLDGERLWAFRFPDIVAEVIPLEEKVRVCMVSQAEDLVYILVSTYYTDSVDIPTSPINLINIWSDAKIPPRKM